VSSVGVRPCVGDETSVDDEVVVDAADGVKSSLNLHQRFPDVSSILVAFDHNERAQRHPGYPSVLDVVILKARRPE